MKENVLDKGYVRLVNSWGSDLDIVNAARVSYDKESSEFSDKDSRLLDFLVRDRHDSVFRHSGFTFEVYAPLMVARQWYKHAVGSTHLDEQMGWNESSRRYITENEEFYVPLANEWRSAPANSKQGSGDALETALGAKYTTAMWHLIDKGMELYKEALEDGVAPEQARLMLPAYSMYVRWRWTASLNAVLHFISLRTKGDAQSEIREYADVINEIAKNKFPETVSAWNRHRV